MLTELGPSSHARAAIRTLTPDERGELETLALRVRAHCITMAARSGCFLGASLSCVDLLVHLYVRTLHVSPSTVASADRDYLLLSKGHDVPALYGVLVERGFFPVERLAHHATTNDDIYWHPNTNIPGVEFHSGSLGHLPSVALGIAYDLRLRGSARRVFVVTGDGGLNEGSVWEAVLVASAKRLDNVVFIVDRNGIQANERTESLVPLEPLGAKFAAFGASVIETDGHDFDALEASFQTLPLVPGKPTVVIARTLRGKGLPSIEDRIDRWFCRISESEAAALLRELHSQGPALLTSSPLVVR